MKDESTEERVSLTNHNVYLCAPGTSIADSRVLLSSLNETRSVLLVLQFMSTDSSSPTPPTPLSAADISHYCQAIQINIVPNYPNYRVVLGIISNRPASKKAMTALAKNTDTFLMSKEQILKFSPLLAHRLHATFLPEFKSFTSLSDNSQHDIYSGEG